MNNKQCEHLPIAEQIEWAEWKARDKGEGTSAAGRKEAKGRITMQERQEEGSAFIIAPL